MTEPRCALITGASRGIGRAIAVRLAREGYDIAGCFRTESQESAHTAQLLQAHPVRTLWQPCDISNQANVEAFVSAAERELGPITALVNNAGIVRDAPLVTMSADDWADVV